MKDGSEERIPAHTHVAVQAFHMLQLINTHTCMRSHVYM